jgi:NitT/TauT family transport system permease protein
MAKTTRLGAPATPRFLKGLRENSQAILFYVALAVLWEIAYRVGMVRAFILPGPSMIMESMAANWDSLLSNGIVTAREILIGFLVGALIGFVMALGIFYSKVLRRIVYPGAVFLQTVPKVALAPLFIIWFGVGETSIVAITALICLFPVLVNTVVGFEGVDVNLLEMMHSVSASGWQKFRMIYVPASLPSIFAGLEVGMSLAVVGAIVGEFVGARAGLGYQILMANSRIATDEVFAAIIIISALGMLFYFGVRMLGKAMVGTRANTRAVNDN